jgi:hypothetical protein
MKLGAGLLKKLAKKPIIRRAPNEPRAGTASAGGVTFNANITVPGGGAPDERSLIAKLGRESQKLGLVSP